MHTTECPKCHRAIRNNNYERHVKVCDGLIHETQSLCEQWKQGDVYVCPYCSKTFSGQGICTHIINKHTQKGQERVKRNYQNLVNKTEGRVWNKGLTKETDERIQKRCQVRKEKYLRGEFQGYWKGKKHSEEQKRKISLKMSILNKGGKCKWYEFEGVKVQGTWELNIVKKLQEFGIKWNKIKTNSHTMQYFDDNNKQHSYTPDFYLKEYDVYLEIKGFWWGNDKRKMEIVMSTHPNKKIVIVEKDLYNSLKDSQTKEEFLKLLKIS